MPKPFDVNEKAILNALRKNSLPTGELADRLGQSRSAVYRFCKKLEYQHGKLTSQKGYSLNRLYFFPKLQEVLTSENYDRIHEEIEKSDEPDVHLYPFSPRVRIWRLSPKALSELPGKPTIPPPIKGARPMIGDATQEPPKPGKKTG